MKKKNFTPLPKQISKQTGGMTKEGEPFRLGQEIKPEEIQEAVEHKPEEEVSEYVSPRQETIEIPPDLKKMGLRPTTTTQFPTYQNIKLPISDEKISVGLHAPITSSLRWLATFALYLLRQAHLGLKTIHGKVIRVLKT